MMASKEGSAPRDRLPIKLIMPKQGTERKVKGGGSTGEPFRPVSTEFRAGLSKQLSAASDAVLPQLAVVRACALRVKVIPKATAKTHRPEALFSENTCPIIGAGALGELFVKATPAGLKKLHKIVRKGDSPVILKQLSSIDSIEAITPRFRLRNKTATDVLRMSPRRENAFIVKVRLFETDDEDDQVSLVEHFKNVCQQEQLSWSTRGYQERSHVYAVECRTVEHVKRLSRTVGVRTISRMPPIRGVRPQSLGALAIPVLPEREKQSSDQPVVVVVDSGVSTSVPSLESWVVGRTSDVAPQVENKDHGTFVAGLICWGRTLNPSLPSINDEPCAIYDLQVLPNDDPDKGDVEELLESEFLQSLESALKRLANTHKVWNLSLGTDVTCSLDEFSELAEQLDNLQEQYKVSFVIAVGNYESLPLLGFPRKGKALDAGRITAPADSVLGVAVGSVSHVDLADDGICKFSPSTFSRHGAGPNYIIKPDLVHCGGTCSTDGQEQHGIRSVIADGTLAEDIGTSFAAPFVSRSLAQIYHQITPTPTPVLARALLTHHARDPRTRQRVPDGDEDFLGFGMPEPVPYCLECSPSTATLVFDDVLRPGYFLEWDDFPYPPSLMRDGRYFGEVTMTLAFAPVRGARWGSEYCETHISASLGVYYDQTSRVGGKVSQKYRGLVPPEHRNSGELYESYQIENLRKWAPVRTYRGDMGKSGQRGKRWRLKLQLLTRHHVEDNLSRSGAQPFSLIVTINDSTGKAPVYDEMSRIVRNRFKAENLVLRAQQRLRH